MTFLALQCFIETVNCGTITAAAKKLMMEQPNVSRQITGLERELGFSLFVRDHHRLRLTEAGNSYYEAVKGVPACLRSARTHAAQIANNTKSIINVGALEGQRLNSLLLEKAELFQHEHPDVTINLEQADFDALKNGLKDG